MAKDLSLKEKFPKVGMQLIVKYKLLLQSPETVLYFWHSFRGFIFLKVNKLSFSINKYNRENIK